MQNSALDKKPTNALLSHHPMTHPTHLPATVPASGGALTTTPGTQRIATRMADDLLNVARSRERALAAQRRYRIGEYEFREPDHAQIQRWARMLGMGPEAVVEELAGFQKESFWMGEAANVNFRVHDGHIVSLAWDFDTFPLADWAWVEGLKLERLGIHNPVNGHLPPLPRSLRGLFCYQCGLTDLDLTPVPGLTRLSCSDNQLTDLDLTPVPGLVTLYCHGNQLTDLDLTPVPGLTYLDCRENQLTNLDLTPVPRLTELDCNQNQLPHLDLTPVPGLTSLSCGENQLTDLDLTPVPGLTSLWCCENQLTDLDLTPVPGLTSLWSYENQLTDLDLTPVPGLTELSCSYNQLTNLDLTPVPGLTYLYCRDNQLTHLDLTPVQRLRWLNCDKNLRLTNVPRDLKVRHP